MSTQKVINLVNGVNVDAVNSTVEAIKGNPEIAKFKFHLHNNWINGGHNRSIVNSFYGANQENSHLQTFKLEADLSSCLTSTLIYHAALRGIKIDELESELEGDIDLRGFLGLTNGVKKGYENIRVNFKVKTDEKNIEKLKALSKLSPVFDVTSHGTNVDVRIERN
jgi:uncharacterized OsmC-like protein